MATPERGDGTCGIFLSYRRDDTRHLAARVYDRLAERFGDARVFMDVDSIEAGLDFAAVLDSAITSCEVVLALIGPAWLTARDERGRRRLDDPGDFVVLEIATALDRDVRVLPVLVDGAAPPRAADLPESLRPLARRQALRLDHETFRSDVDALTSAVTIILGGTRPSTPAPSGPMLEADYGRTTARRGQTSTTDGAPVAQPRALPHRMLLGAAAVAVVTVALAVAALMNNGFGSGTGPTLPPIASPPSSTQTPSIQPTSSETTPASARPGPGPMPRSLS